MSNLIPQLSLVTSEEYRQWKSDTLANQNCHHVEMSQENERKKVRTRARIQDTRLLLFLY